MRRHLIALDQMIGRNPRILHGIHGIKASPRGADVTSGIERNRSGRRNLFPESRCAENFRIAGRPLSDSEAAIRCVRVVASAKTAFDSGLFVVWYREIGDLRSLPGNEPQRNQLFEIGFLKALLGVAAIEVQDAQWRA